MELTQEQLDIIETVHNQEPIVKINAYAGTGKTTTLVEVVKEIRKTEPESKILYLVFNKMMAKEASKKFGGLNVRCYTAHGFALRRMGLIGKPVRVLDGSNFTSEYFKLRDEDKKFKYIRYKDFKLLMDTYTSERSEMKSFLMRALQYGIDETKFRKIDLEFFVTLYERLLSECKYTHGMYLKEYALNHHDIIKGYDYILLDEAQDLNPFMMDIIKRIQRKKLYVVGDNYQQIYSWNKAINSMQKYEGDLYPLSKSFRFNNDIREIADYVLRMQSSYRDSETKITNVHNETSYDDSKITILFRTNSAMLSKAIDIVSKEDNVKVHFMDMINGGDSNSFDETFNEMLQFTKVLLKDSYGKSNICKEFDKKFPVKVTSKVLKSYMKISEKEDHSSFYEYVAENVASLPLDYIRYFTIFRMLGPDIVTVLEKVRNTELATEFDKEYVLCTAHRAKGLEWEYVIIAPDAWKLDNLDEINLIYVACTRAMRKLDYSGIEHIIEYAKSKYEDTVSILE